MRSGLGHLLPATVDAVRQRWLQFRRALQAGRATPLSVQAEYLRLLYRNLAASTPVALAVVIYVAWLADPKTSPHMRTWSMVYVVYLCIRGLTSVMYLRAREMTWTRLRRWSALAVLLQSTAGVLLSVVALFIMPLQDLYIQVVGAMIVLIWVGATVFSLSGRWIDTLVYAPPIYLSFAWGIAQQPHPYAHGVGLLTVALLVLHLVYASNHHKSIAEGFEVARRSAILARELQFKNIEFQEVASARSRLLATVSHDLRQPAHAIGLLSERALADSTDPRVKDTLRDLNELSQSLSASLITLMDLTRLDAGLVQPRLGPVSLDRLLTQLDAQFGASARSKGLDFSVQRTDQWVHSDPVLLQGVLGNLVSNAIKYTRQGRVAIRVFERDGGMWIEVSDTGVGIPADKLDLIFKEFVRLDASDAGTEGLGLGLSIVRRYASLLSHRLSVQSIAGEGSVFGISLPRAHPLPQADKPLVNADATDQEGLRGLKVLVVDNVELLLVSMTKTLHAWDCSVHSARNLSEALQCVDQGWPDVVLSDFHLGDRESDGLELIKTLRRQAVLCGRAHLAALLMTGDVSAQLEARASEAGVQVLHKPVRPQVLRETLLRLISRSAPAQGA